MSFDFARFRISQVVFSGSVAYEPTGYYKKDRGFPPEAMLRNVLTSTCSPLMVYVNIYKVIRFGEIIRKPNIIVNNQRHKEKRGSDRTRTFYKNKQLKVIAVQRQ